MRLFRRKPKLDQQEIYDWLFRVFSFCDSEARTSALAWLKKTYPNSSDALRQTALLASCASLCNFMAYSASAWSCVRSSILRATRC